MPPKGAKYIGRPSCFENLHTIASHGREEAIRLFRLDLTAMAPLMLERCLDMLEGYEFIMCWCPLDEVCHGDVWLELLADRARKKAAAATQA